MGPINSWPNLFDVKPLKPYALQSTSESVDFLIDLRATADGSHRILQSTHELA